MENSKKITFKQLNEINFYLTEVLVKEHDLTDPSKNKLTWAIYRLTQNLKAPLEEYNRKVGDIFHKHASVDKNDNVLYENLEKNVFKITKAALALREQDLLSLGAKTVTIETYIYQNNDYIKKKYGYMIKTAMNGVFFDIKDVIEEPENDVEYETEEEKDKKE